jgi:hypothetical protein
MAGVLQRRLIGPIWKDGQLVTKLWLGNVNDPEAGSENDVRAAILVTIAAAALATASAVIVLSTI